MNWPGQEVNYQPPSVAGQPVVDLSDPTKAAGDARDETRTGIAVRGEVRDVNKTEFDQKGALYERYTKLPEVKNYRVAVQQLAQAIETGDGPQADLALTYAFAKAMDPESVVRESEQGMVTGSQPWFQSAVEATKKQFGMDGAGNYTPETRKQIRAQIANAVAQRNKLYNQQREYFTELAKRNNFDPYEVVGEHDANPFAERIRAWGREGQQSDARDPEMVGGLAKGTNVTFAGDDGTGFNRNKWLLETTGFTPDGEANLIAWMSANSGNPNITKEDVQAAYQRFSDGRSSGAVDDEFMAKFRAQKTPWQGFDSSFAENQLKIKAEQLAQERDTLGGATDAFVRGAAQVPSFGLADKLQAATETVFGGGTYDENMDRQRLINAADEIANPYARMGGELTGAVLTPYGAGARTPAELAKVAAVTSGATEFNQSSAPFAERILPSALAAGTGALMGYGTGKVVEEAAPFFGNMAERMRGNAAQDMAGDLPPELSRPEFIAAAQRQGVDYLPADLPGANATQIATAITDKTFGSKFIQDGAQKSVNSVQNAVTRTTDNLGGAGDNVAAGQAVQRGVNAWEDAANKRVSDLENKIPIKPNQNAVISNSVGALEDIQSRFSSNPELAGIVNDPRLSRYLTALRGRKEDISTGVLDAAGNPITKTRKFGGALSYQDLRAFRTEVGEMIGRPAFQSDISDKQLRNLYGALTRDIEQTASKVGPQALKAFKVANAYKRGVETRRENVMGMLLGKKLDMSPEKTFAQIQSWAKAKGGDFAKLSQAVRSLPDEEANAVRATIIDTLGKSTDGAQNSVGTAFSPSTFATRWNQLSPRAKAVLFQGEHRAALDDIAGLSTAMKNADRYNNKSNTGVVVGGAFTYGSTFANPLITAGVVGSQLLSGVILGSPRVAKWAAALSKKPNQQAMMAHIARLDNIAKAEPVIANDILQLQTRLREAFTGTPEKLAASEPDQKSQSLPPANTTTAGAPQ